MLCPKCNSSNVSVQAVNEVSSVKERKGCVWWLFVGWWWVPIKWLCLTIPAIIVKMFGKRRVVTSKTVTKAVCQNCGHMWEIE